jgi:EAL domain-containing protein (putative c-di-GMP-specific phosphodiesterase class I)
MQHTIEDLIKRINVMHDLAIQVHRLRNEFSEQAEKQYDIDTCNHLIEQIQSMALGIANDKQGTEIKTEMEYKNV